MKRLLVAGLLVIACSSATPTPSPMPEPTPSPTPSSTPIPPEAYRALPGGGTRLAPGLYVKSGFTPTVGFAVVEGWTTVEQLPGFFDIQADPGSLDVVAVQFARASGATAELAAANIESRDHVVVGAREGVTIGGLSGIRLIVDTADPADSQPVIFRPVMDTPPGPISIGSGRRLEINLFTASDGVLAILVGGSIARWDRALALSEPVLESVVISD